MSKKLTNVASFVVVLVMVLTSMASAADPDLIGWWRLDGDATDSSGNNHDGTIFGDPQWVTGKIAGALELDGVDDRVEMPGTNPAAGFTFTGEVTWAVWVKTSGRTARSTIICQGPPGAAHVSGNRTLGIEIPGTVTVRANGVGAAANFTSNVAVTDDQWHHVAVTIAFETNGTNDMIKVYIDGDLSKGYETDTVNINQNMANATEFIILVGHVTGNSSWLPFAGLIDDVRVYSRVLTEAEVKQAMKGLPGLASNPSPANEATDVPREVVLSWEPGEYAAPTNGHKVYFGENFNDVNDATGAVAQSAASYTPPQRPGFGQTYYWRVDEVNAPPDNTIFKGEVWSFTTEPIGYPIDGANITAAASSSMSDSSGPQKTIDGSGLNGGDLHSTDLADMWLSDMMGTQPTWIEYQFDKVYKLHKMWVWNQNQVIEPSIGYGFKDVSIEYSVDGIAYTTLGTTHEFARAPGAAVYAANTTVDFAGAAAKYVRLTANSNWGGILTQYGLSEVRFFSMPVFAREPSPDSGATDVGVEVTLGWRAGREGATHDMYLGTDEQAVIDGTAPVMTVTEASYAAPVDLAGTYYWRIDEVNEAETPATWQGDVWDFTTQEYLVVEDFESYNDIPAGEEGSNLIYLTWADGFENPSANGSTIGYTEAFQPTMETSIVYDGTQSVPLFYNNTVAPYSEVTANVADLQAGQDWDKHGIKALALRFYGDPNNSVNDQMYVKIDGAKVTYDSDAENLKRVGWQMWYIDLVSMDVSPANVTDLAIGFERIGAFGGQGVVLLDGIRLYSHDRQLITPTDPGTTGLQAHYEFEGTTNDSSGNARHGTIMGNPTFVAGPIGQAISFDGLNDYVNIDGYKGVVGDGIDTPPWAVTAWVRTSDNGEVVGWGSTGDGNRMEFRIDAGRTRAEGGGGNTQGDTSINDGGWHHIAVTIQPNSVYSNGIDLWVDGQVDTRSNNDPDPWHPTANFDVKMGIRYNESGRQFTGEIDDVRIYDRVLSQEEIAWLAGRIAPFDKPF